MNDLERPQENISNPFSKGNEVMVRGSSGKVEEGWFIDGVVGTDVHVSKGTEKEVVSLEELKKLNNIQ